MGRVTASGGNRWRGRTVHILRSGRTARPWWPAHERLNIPAAQRIWCDCCNAWGYASQVDARLLSVELPVGGPGDYGPDDMERAPWRRQKRLGFYDFIMYGDDARWETKCAEGYGCTVNPRRRASRHLREHLTERF